MSRSKKDITIRQVVDGWIISVAVYEYGNEEQPNVVTNSGVTEIVATSRTAVAEAVNDALAE